MNSTRRETCAVCNGAQTLPDPDTAAGWRVCGECNGLGHKFVNADAPSCDVITHEEARPTDAR